MRLPRTFWLAAVLCFNSVFCLPPAGIPSFSDPLGSINALGSTKVTVSLADDPALVLESTRQLGPVTESLYVTPSNNAVAQAAETTVVDLQGAHCETQCGFTSGLSAVPSDCAVVYNTLYGMGAPFTIQPRAIVHWAYQKCAAYLINNTDASVKYDYGDYGGVTQWLNGYCVIGKSAVIGTCKFKQYGDFASGVYTSVNHPSYFQ